MTCRLDLLVPFLMALPLAGASGAELAAEGVIDSTFTYVNTPTVMPSADGNEASLFDVSLVLTGQSAGSLLDKMVGRCLFAGPNNPTTGAFRITGWCTYTDSNGDMIFASDEESGDSFTAPPRGTGKLLGGTGRYAGISGGYDYTDEYFGTPKQGVFGGAGVKHGSYKIAR
jgi:hypothetical protein